MLTTRMGPDAQADPDAVGHYYRTYQGQYHRQSAEYYARPAVARATVMTSTTLNPLARSSR